MAIWPGGGEWKKRTKVELQKMGASMRPFPVTYTEYAEGDYIRLLHLV